MFNRSWCKEYVCNMRNGVETTGFKVYMGGPGGTGKSHVIKLIRRDVIYFLQQTMQVKPDEPLVLLTAPTGLAAFNIGGITLHSAFMLNCSNSNDEFNDWEKRSTMQLKLNKIALIIIDEISMVGASTFGHVCEMLKKIKQKTIDWGGVAILAVGDFYQLPPVGQSPVYARPRHISSPGDLAPPLWDDFLTHELIEVMRQKDVEFACALNRICKGAPERGSPDDLMLQSCELKIPHTNESYPSCAMHVYAENQYCSHWNNIRLDALEGTLYSYVADDMPKDRHTNLAHMTFSDKPRLTGNLVKTLNVKVGARVMVSTNIDVGDGLTNGAMGTVSGVILKQNRLDVILVQFDSDRIGIEAKACSKYKHIDSKSVPIHKIEAIFKPKKGCKVRVSRTQFPLYLCWAVTIHKCQGMTLPEIVVDMTREKGRFKDGQAYVAFSRVTSLENLHIINSTCTQTHASQSVAEEMARDDKKVLNASLEPMVYGVDKTSNVVVVHLNVCNLLSKHLDIQSDKIWSHADVICLNETHLSSQNVIQLELLGLTDDYRMYRKDRDDHGGGVMVVVHKSLCPRQIITTRNLEIVIVQISIGTKKLYIASVYRSPKCVVSSWVCEMEHVLDMYRDKEMCILGDVNEDITCNGVSKPIYNMFISKCLKQHVLLPTRDSGTLIDHVYTLNIPEDNVQTDVTDCYYSDHDIVSCSISFNN